MAAAPASGAKSRNVRRLFSAFRSPRVLTREQARLPPEVNRVLYVRCVLACVALRP